MLGLLRDARRLIVGLVIVAFSIAALMGIAALLIGGFGDTEAKILLTTVIVGVESVAVLCYLTVANRRVWWVGAIGGVVSAVATVFALLFTWAIDFDDVAGKTFAVTAVAAASIAQACLLLAMASRRTVAWVLAGALVAITVVAVMISWAIIDGADLGGTFWRLFGVVAILDVLATVVLSALGAGSRGRATPAAAGGPEASAPATAALDSGALDTGVWAKAQRLARERGIEPSTLVDQALDAYARRGETDLSR